MKTGIGIVVCMGIVAGVFVGRYLIDYAGDPGGRNSTMAKYGTKPAVAISNGMYLDEDGDPQPSPGLTKKGKLVQGGETAVTGKYDIGKYADHGDQAPSFDYSETTPQPKRESWVDGQKPSAMTAEQSRAVSEQQRRQKVRDEESASAPAKKTKDDELKLRKMRSEIENQRNDKNFYWDGKDNGVSFDQYLQKKYGFELWQKS